MTKSKTVEEFLANGGKITKVPPVVIESKQVCQNTTYRAPQFLSLEEADELYGESRNRSELETDDDIVTALTKIVERDPTFLERKNIPDKYVKLLPKALQDAGTAKIHKEIKKIDPGSIPDHLRHILEKQAAKGSSGGPNK